MIARQVRPHREFLLSRVSTISAERKRLSFIEQKPLPVISLFSASDDQENYFESTYEP
jgi:hypothetical protein